MSSTNESTGQLGFSEQVKRETVVQGDDGDDSEQSADAPPRSSRTIETLSSSNASSPCVLKNDEIDEHHNDEDGDSTRISWESVSLSSPSAPSRVTVKLLVSNNMAGSIIGRQGQTVSVLQNKSSARIRLSQSGDYFPGTSDRVCLIHGTLENVKKGVALVLGKLYELQLELVETQLGTTEQIHDEQGTEIENSDGPPKINFTSRILIPSAACGMLIGREGSTIQRLKELAGASSVRLSPKVVDHNSPRTFERILTVSSFELSACVAFASSILDGFVKHAEICRYLNGTTSYSRNSNVAYNAQRNTPVMGYTGSASSTTHVQRQQFTHAIHDVESSLQGLGFDNNAQNPHAQRPAYMQSNAIAPAPSQVSSFLPTGQVPQRTTPSPAPYASTVINLAVPDSMIGAILGRRGQTLQELQAESGARIRVSQRNELVPGTTNRIVTVSGSQENIATARNMIRQILSRNP